MPVQVAPSPTARSRSSALSLDDLFLFVTAASAALPTAAVAATHEVRSATLEPPAVVAEVPERPVFAAPGSHARFGQLLEQYDRLIRGIVGRVGRRLGYTRDTFLTRSLGVVYRTPVPTRNGWEPVTFASDAHRAGIQSHVSFLALHSHPGRSSPTLRGYAARQIFLCQHVPDPPRGRGVGTPGRIGRVQGRPPGQDLQVVHLGQPALADRLRRGGQEASRVEVGEGAGHTYDTSRAHRQSDRPRRQCGEVFSNT